MPGSWPHLARRFFGSWNPAPLSPAEIAEVRSLLTPGLEFLFFGQAPGDQRHGLESYRAVAHDPTATESLTRAALLHDVGKRHARLGIIGRSLATILIKLRLLLPARAQIYRDHAGNGFSDMARFERDPVVLQFALHHHGERPSTFSEQSWKVLHDADEPPRTRWWRPAN